DFVDGVLRCAEMPEAVGHAFNLGNPQGTITNSELANMIIRLTTSKSDIVYNPHPGPEVDLRVPSIEKATTMLGYQPKVALETAVRRLGQLAGRADAALYLAANSDPAASAERPRWDLESNTVGLVNFLESCAVDHLVYVSSGAVYDGLIGPVSPASPVAPRLPYAISKLASEQYVRFFSERRRSVGSFIIVRFFGAYGPYEPARKITTRWLLALAA